MPWTDNLSDEERGYYANKGWDKLAPEAAAAQIGKSYRELERMPRPEPPPREYTFEGLKNPDGSAPEPETLAMVRTLATKLKLPCVLFAPFSFFCSNVARPPNLIACAPRCVVKLSVSE